MRGRAALVAIVLLAASGAGGQPGTPKSAMRLAFPADAAGPPAPAPIVLCARLAAYGLVADRVIRAPGSPVWQCAPQSLTFARSAAGVTEPTSIFTTVRGTRGHVALPVDIRFKLNALDPATAPDGAKLIERAARSVARIYGRELPAGPFEALAEGRAARHERGRLRLSFEPERQDQRRINVYLAIAPAS